MRRRLEAEIGGSMAARAEELKRAHEESARLEIKLRSNISAIERQQSQLQLKEEQMNVRLVQKVIS